MVLNVGLLGNKCIQKLQKLCSSLFLLCVLKSSVAEIRGGSIPVAYID